MSWDALKKSASTENKFRPERITILTEEKTEFIKEAKENLGALTVNHQGSWITPRSSHSKLDFTEEIDEEVSLTFSSESKMAREERPLETWSSGSV